MLPYINTYIGSLIMGPVAVPSRKKNSPPKTGVEACPGPSINISRKSKPKDEDGENKLTCISL